MKQTPSNLFPVPFTNSIISKKMEESRPRKRRRLSPSYSHSQPALSPSRHGRGWAQPPRSSHKRTRREFERDLDHQDPLQTPSKRHKSSSVHSNPFAPPQPQPPSPPPPPPPQHHQSVSSSSTSSPFGGAGSARSRSTGSHRQFQGHSDALREHKKQRQRRMVDHRRSKREEVLRRKHDALKMSDLKFWNFGFAATSTSTPAPAPLSTAYPPPPRSPSSESDESMTDRSNLWAPPQTEPHPQPSSDALSDGVESVEVDWSRSPFGRTQSEHRGDRRENAMADSVWNAQCVLMRSILQFATNQKVDCFVVCFFGSESAR